MTTLTVFTAFTDIAISHEAITTLYPGAPFSDTPEDPSIFLSTLQYYKPVEEPTSVPFSELSEYIISETSILQTTFPPELPSEEAPPVPGSAPSIYPISEPSNLLETSPSYLPSE